MNTKIAIFNLFIILPLLLAETQFQILLLVEFHPSQSIEAKFGFYFLFQSLYRRFVELVPHLTLVLAQPIAID